jgi:hypothetical protein
VADFSPIITQAYQRILGRNPDPGGLASWNRSMNDGLSEAGMREGLLRSAEYAQSHPDRALRASRTGAKAKKAAPAQAKAGAARAKSRGRVGRRGRQ